MDHGIESWRYIYYCRLKIKVNITISNWTERNFKLNYSKYSLAFAIHANDRNEEPWACQKEVAKTVPEIYSLTIAVHTCLVILNFFES